MGFRLGTTYGYSLLFLGLCPLPIDFLSIANVAGDTLGKQAYRGPLNSEHRQNLEVGHLVISRLAQHSFEENRHVLWKEAEILRLERIQFTGSLRKQPA